MSGWDTKIPEDASAWNDGRNDAFEDTPAPIEQHNEVSDRDGDGVTAGGNDGGCFKCGESG